MRAILLRDLRLATRAGGGAGLSLAFLLVVVVLVPFAVGPERETLARVAPGIVWVAALLATLLSLDRLLALDWEDGALALMATAPVPLEGVALAKAAAHWLATGLPLAVAAAPLGLLLGMPAIGAPWLSLSLLLGTPALSLIGTLGAALTVGVKRGGLLMSLLVLPLYVPTLIFGAQAVVAAAAGRDPWPAFLLLGGLSLFILALAPFAAALALRAHLR